MKKFLFWATVVGASLTGCVNDNEAVLDTENNPQAITFEVAKYKASSRADGDAQASTTTTTGYDTYPVSATFGTYGFYAPSTNGAHSPFINQDNVPMQNSKVGYANNVWTVLSDTYFWPQDGHVDFVSYSPYSTEASKIPTIGHVSGTDYNSLSFTDYVVGTDDLMYSDKAHLQTHNKELYYKSGVPTLFRHALAKLNFKVATKYVQTTETVGSQSKNLYWRVAVKSIALNGIFNKGSLILHTSSPSEAGTTQYEIANYKAGDAKVWIRANSQTSKAWNSAGADGQVLTVTATNFADATDYFVLPQTFTVGEQSITITYTVSNKVGETGTYDTPTEFTKTLSFVDYNVMVPAWEMGKNITYTILIDPKGDVINFDPAIADWEEQSGTLDI